MAPRFLFRTPRIPPTIHHVRLAHDFYFIFILIFLSLSTIILGSWASLHHRIWMLFFSTALPWLVPQNTSSNALVVLRSRTLFLGFPIPGSIMSIPSWNLFWEFPIHLFLFSTFPWTVFLILDLPSLRRLISSIGLTS